MDLGAVPEPPGRDGGGGERKVCACLDLGRGQSKTPGPSASAFPPSILMHLGMEPLPDLNLYTRKATFLESDLWVQGKTESTLIRGLVWGFVLLI